MTGRSLEEDLAAAYDEVEAAIPAASEPAGEVEAPAAVETPAETTEAAAERARDELGRFASKPTEAVKPATEQKPVEQAQKPVPGKPETTDPSVPAKVPETASKPVTGPPVSWSADAKQAWATLPPAIQAAVVKREQEASDGFARYATENRQLKEVFTPLEAQAKASGMTATEGVRALMAVENGLRNPATALETLLRVAASYNIPLESLAARAQPQAPGSQPTRPQPAAIDIRGEVRRAIESERETALRSSVSDELAAFEADPSHLHFSDPRVRGAMRPLVESGKSLQEAYEEAVWVLPEFRESQRQADDERRQREAREKADRSRRAAVSITGAPPNGSAPVYPRESLEDEIRSLMNGAPA